jgi:DNA-binding Xre family transcriptional regulator
MIDVGLAHKGMAGKELAHNMGKDPSSISQMKRQKTVTPKTLKLLADSLGFTVSELIELGK